MVRRQFLTPPNLPETTVERCLVIPYSKEWLGIFNDALLELAQSYNYEQVHDTDMTPEDVAAICYDIYVQYLAGACGMNCEELLACLAEAGGTTQQVRINPETGAYERSTDGGETWEEAPGLDPRISSAPYAPIDGEDCSAANAITGMLQRFIDEQDDVLELGGTIFSIVSVLVALLAVVFSGGIAMGVLILAANVALSQGHTAIAAAMTAGVYEQFRCIVHCAIREVTEITQTEYDAIVEAVNAEFTFTAHAMITSFLQTFGPVGLQNAATLSLAAGGIPEDCDDCECPGDPVVWSWNFEGTIPGPVTQVAGDKDAIVAGWGNPMPCWQGRFNSPPWTMFFTVEFPFDVEILEIKGQFSLSATGTLGRLAKIVDEFGTITNGPITTGTITGFNWSNYLWNPDAGNVTRRVQWYADYGGAVNGFILLDNVEITYRVL